MSEAGVTTLAWVLKDRGGASHWSSSSSWDKAYPAPSKGNQEQIRGVSWNALVLLALVCPSVLAAVCAWGIFLSIPVHSSVPSLQGLHQSQCWPTVFCSHLLRHLLLPLIPSPSELGLLFYLVSDVIFLGGLRAHVLV